jgi:hypothetical protein
MTPRSRREIINFRHPFRIKGIDRQFPLGACETITDEEMIAIEPVALSDAQHIDASKTDE